MRELMARAVTEGQIPAVPIDTPTPASEAPTPAPEVEPQGFTHRRWWLQNKATRMAVELRGPGVLKTKAGRAFVARIYDYMNAGDTETLIKLRTKYQWNKMPRWSQMQAKSMAITDELFARGFLL